MGVKCLQLRDVAMRYGEGPDAVAALDSIGLSVDEHEFVSIVGPSGCGKSTLLMLISGLIPPTTGTIEVGGARVKGAVGNVAIVFQRDVLLDWRTVLANVLLPVEIKKLDPVTHRRKARDLLRSVGLEEFEDKYPGELSGGMRQRVAFARTMLTGKPVLLLDEPFAGLDAITRAEMQEWLDRTLADEARPVVLVTHDVEEALYLCDRVAVLSARPGSVRAYVDGAPAGADRTHTVTSPEFMERKQRALEALR